MSICRLLTAVSREKNEDTNKRKTQERDTLPARTEGKEHISRQKRKAMKEYSRTEEHRERDLSGHAKKPTKKEALTNWRGKREGLVRTRKETDQARLTHFLETAEGGTFQDTERKRPSKAHSQPGGRRGRDLSGQRRTATKRGALTC